MLLPLAMPPVSPRTLATRSRNMAAVPRAALLVPLVLALLSLGARRDYVGSEVCGSCHPAQLAAWRATAHARAERAVPRDAVRCRACHSTGDAPTGAAYFPDVGCESCHGPGAAYADDDVMRDPQLARLLGLVDLADPAIRTVRCARCHAGPSTRLTPPDLALPAHPGSGRSPSSVR